MVFQASEKKTVNINSETDFKDLQLIKQAEEKAIQNILAAKSKAERIITDAERDVIAFKQKEIEELIAKLEKDYQREEKRAITEAKKIKEEGELEAEQLKRVVQAKMPQAVDHIVKAVMSRI